MHAQGNAVWHDPYLLPYHHVLRRAVFAVDGEERTWAQVLDAARGWGEWAAVEEAAAKGLAANPGGMNATAPAREAERLATEFRYQHGLLSADETKEWLAGWGLTVTEWVAYLERRVAAARAEGGPHAGPQDPQELEAAAWVEGVVSGVLERTARRLADALAVHRGRGGTGDPGVAELDDAVTLFASEAAPPDAVAEAIAENRLEWTIYDLAEVAVGEEGVARELLYSVRDDGRAVEEVATEAGLSVTRERRTLAELPAELGARLAGAREGEVIGPLPAEDRWRVILVESRIEASAEQPEVAGLARERLVARAVGRESARRIRWLDPLATPRG